MGKVLSSGGGGGTIFSSDLTVKAGHVLKGDSYVGNDTNDDTGVGTMPNIAAIDDGLSLSQSGNKLYCRMHNGAHIQNASSGYPEVSFDLASVRKAVGYTDTSKVLTGTAIAGANGTMKNLSDAPNTRFQSGNSTPVLIGDAGFWSTNTDGKARLQIRYNGTQGFIKPNTLIGVEKGTLKSAVISAYGIASVTSFKISQYNTKTVLCSWAKPANGKMWSGVVVRAKQGGYPANVNDGTEITGGTNGTSVTKVLGTGTWYFRFWNYVTVSGADGSRWYDGGTNGGAFNNQEVRGSQNFTGSTTFVVPTGVRTITAFCVGGGGGNSCPYIGRGQVGISSGAGGGYTKTASFAVTPGESLTITVGGGGTRGPGGSGGTSGIYRGSTALITAAGGQNANYTVGDTSYGAGRPHGGNGGSGGGGSYGIANNSSKSTQEQESSGGSGGSDGGDASECTRTYWTKSGDSKTVTEGCQGIGQHYSTKAWGNTGQPYSPGSSGTGMGARWGYYGSEGGQRGRGGAGLTGANSGAAYFGAWAKCYWERNDVWEAGSNGGSGQAGIVMIRWG